MIGPAGQSAVGPSLPRPCDGGSGSDPRPTQRPDGPRVRRRRRRGHTDSAASARGHSDGARPGPCRPGGLPVPRPHEACQSLCRLPGSVSALPGECQGILRPHGPGPCRALPPRRAEFPARRARLQARQAGPGLLAPGPGRHSGSDSPSLSLAVSGKVQVQIEVQVRVPLALARRVLARWRRNKLENV